MSMRDWFDVAGYAVAVGLLLVVISARLLKFTPPSQENAFFLVFAGALTIASAFPDAHLNRWLAFMGLWLAWSATFIPISLRLHFWLRVFAVLVINGFSVAVVLTSIYSIGRPSIINPNTAAAILLLCLPLAMPRSAPLEPGWKALKPFAMILLALVFTGSRGALLGLAVAALWFARPRIPKNRRVWVVLCLAVASALMICIRPGTVTARLDHWGEALRLWSAQPLTGWGASSYLSVSHIPAQVHADSAVLTLAAEQGWIGLLALAPLAVLVVRRYRTAPGWMRIGLLALFVQNLVDDTWLSPWPAILLGLNLGIMCSLDVIHKEALAGVDPAGGALSAPTADQRQPVV